MGKRLEDGSWKDACLDKLKPGEPFFVLRAQDKLAPTLVRDWALMAKLNGAPDEKILEAQETAAEMENWPNRKFPD